MLKSGKKNPVTTFLLYQIFQISPVFQMCIRDSIIEVLLFIVRVIPGNCFFVVTVEYVLSVRHGSQQDREKNQCQSSAGVVQW